ncbi:MAG: response regulator transcription factor [Verrucomicrobiota bacterium]|nr:response regulator transcription factor [Limisphaerales bacterium]
MKGITVLLAEDHMIVREGIRKLLEAEPDLKVVGEAPDGRAAVALVKKLRPAVVVMDIAMPRLNGFEATRQILRAIPATRVLMLSAHGDLAYIREAISAGAQGFLLKQASAHVVCAAIREVHRGNRFYCPEIAKRLCGRDGPGPARSAVSPRPAASLTSRELEVLQLIAEGKANKETATELGISVKTVQRHREHLMAKLNLHDTAGLTRYAIGAGVIESTVPLAIL